MATSALAAFVVLDVALVGLALRSPPSGAEASPRPRPTPGASSPAPTTPTGTTTGMTTGTTTGTATGTARTPSTPGTSSNGKKAGTPLTVMVAALDATRAWRATTGTCARGGAVVETTTDAGRTWTRSAVPVTVVARVQPLAAGRGLLVGSGADCAPAQYSTVDGAGSWLAPTTVAGGWSRLPASRTTVLTPERPQSRPCGENLVVDLARAATEQAAVLCADGAVTKTTDGGVSWTAAGTVTGALAVGSRVEGAAVVTYAARTDRSCVGVSVVSVVPVSAGRAPRALACVPASGATAGTVALSVVRGAGWLVVGDQTWVAGADLGRWKQS